MKCTICRVGETKPAHTSVTLERNGATLVFKEVPADICQNCGEEYVDEKTTRNILDQANSAVKNGVQIDVRSYVAA